MSSQRTQEELGEIMSRSNQAVSQEKGVRSTRGMVVLNFSLDQYHNQYVFGHVRKLGTLCRNKPILYF